MVTKMKSRIEDNTHIYTIVSGSGREGLSVYLVASHANRVALANAGDVLTSQVVGIIKRDYGESVEIDFSGDVDAVPQNGITFGFGNNVFLSSIESGKVTNISPNIGVCVRLGSSVKMKTTGKVQINLLIGEVIEL